MSRIGKAFFFINVLFLVFERLMRGKARKARNAFFWQKKGMQPAFPVEL
jgi:hypothetical protein